MTANDRTRPITSADQLTQGLSDLAGSSRTDYRLDILQQVARTRQRPAWTFPERWLPMALIARPATAPPLRRTWNMLLIALVALTLVAAVAITGALLLNRRTPSDQNAAVLVPTVDLDQAWDATTIPGLSLPSGLDVGPDGNLYVANAGADEILVLSPSGTVVRRWGEHGTGEGQFMFQGDTQNPRHRFGGVAVADDGSVYVMDLGNDRVQQFDPNGSFVRQWGGYGVGDGQFVLAYDIAVGPDADVYVKDAGRGDVQRFSPEGTFREKIGSEGVAEGQMSGDGGIAVDHDGNVYSADTEGHRALSWAADGTYRWAFGSDGTGPAKLTYPGDVAIDNGGYIYVTEFARLVVYTPDRALGSVWDIPDADPTDGWNPMTIGPDGTLYMSVWHQDVIHRLRIAERDQDATLVVAPNGSSPPAGTPEAASPAAPAVHAESIGSPFAVPFTVHLPDGWSVGDSDNTTGYASVGKLKENSTYAIYAGIQVFVPTNAYADPCRTDGGPMSPPVGPSVEDLAAVLSSQPGFHLMQPVTDITIDGYNGKTFELESSLIQSECDDGTWFPQWTFDDRGAEAHSGPGPNFHQRIAILDVDGTRVLIESWTFNDTSFADRIATNEIFESIDFE